MVTIKEIILGVYGIMSSAFLTLFIWWALIYGGEKGSVTLYFNLYNEMMLEFFLLNGLLILMIILFISILKKDLKLKSE